MSQNTGFQQSIYAAKFTAQGSEPLDIDGNFCSLSGKKQAILLLEGYDNPDPDKYEVSGTFSPADVIDGYPSIIYNTDACPLPVDKPEDKPEQFPEYEKEALSSVYIRLNPNTTSVNGEGYNVLARDWDNPNAEFGLGGENKGTYATRRIGEYEWTLENWKMCYNSSRNYRDYIVDQAILDQSGVAMTEEESNQKNGCYVYGGSATTRFLSGLEFYESTDQKNLLSGWRVPALDDYTQLLGMIGTDLSPANVMKHLFVSPTDTELPWISTFNTASSSQDLLGARLIPCGHKRNTTLVNGGKIYQFGERMAYGLSGGGELIPVIYFNMAAGDKVGSVVYDDYYNIEQIDSSVKGWQRNYRFCRPLSDAELGYRLWRDDANDQVLVTALQDPRPENTTELEKGLLRGLAVRWMNKDKTKVLAPLSQLLKEIDTTKNGESANWYGFHQ